jgi:Rrf2 family protein
MQISARADYALRALLTLAASDGQLVKGESLALAQDLPLRFLENILTDLRRAGLVQSRRGADGGYQLGRPADQITVATVIRVTDGPLASVRGRRRRPTTRARPKTCRTSGSPCGSTCAASLRT